MAALARVGIARRASTIRAASSSAGDRPEGRRLPADRVRRGALTSLAKHKIERRHRAPDGAPRPRLRRGQFCRLESNVHSATVLGIVGAGGIGMILWGRICGFYHAETSAVLIIIVGSVSLLNIASQRLRKMFI